MPRVLVADSNGLVLWSVGRVLLQAGYELVTADSVAQALEETARGTIDVVIAADILPDDSGVELLRKIKTSTPRTHVIMIAREDSSQLERLVRDIGAIDYFGKPFELKAVVSSVARARVMPERRRGPRA
jgi:DNA-binding response OmpR family regulator